MADVVFEATGNPRTVEICINSLRKNGRLVLIGILHEPVTADLSKIVRHELNVKGSICYTWEDYEKSIELVSKGKVKVEPMISHRFKLKDIDKGLEAIHKKQAIKVILKP